MTLYQDKNLHSKGNKNDRGGLPSVGPQNNGKKGGRGKGKAMGGERRQLLKVRVVTVHHHSASKPVARGELLIHQPGELIHSDMAVDPKEKGGDRTVGVGLCEQRRTANRSEPPPEERVGCAQCMGRPLDAECKSTTRCLATWWWRPIQAPPSRCRA